ncbi:MAG: gamma-glutamyltransferase [Gammaproteobacteria bacterium]|nr:gamma-glutamyltransferase [Gammaproteobacteria bacterium]
MNNTSTSFRSPAFYSATLLFLLLIFCIQNSFAAQQLAAGIATAHPLATDAGLKMLNEGGNAFDAAVAVTAALAVVEPMSSGLGGGGFWLLHRAKDKFETMLDGREKAPLAATRDMYLDKEGNVIKGLSITGPLAAGIPGIPAAIVHLSKKYGQLPLAKVLAPAIEYAKNGFAVDDYFQRTAKFRLEDLKKSPEAEKIFLTKGKVPAIGHIIKQPDLANTLEAIVKQGHNGFYGGAVAKKLVSGTKAAGGIWTLQDLKEYKVIERKPIKGEYHGMQITSAPPPSSGGIALVEMFNILNDFDMVRTSKGTQAHLIVETMRRAYRDRAQHLGDLDFYEVPVERLTNKKYASKLAASIDEEKATASSSLPGVSSNEGGKDTTHFSIIDANGNRVASTLTINYPFGSGFVPPGTGVLLNDEMDDFSAKPGTPNAYGLVGGKANAIEPGKRPLSSMTPTFLENKRGVAVLGTPGGSRIITMVLLASLDYFAGGTAQSMVALPRYHHQYLPDVIQHEKDSFSAEQQKELQAMGHTLKLIDGIYGNMHVVIWDKKENQFSAASDPRVNGKAVAR